MTGADVTGVNTRAERDSASDGLAPEDIRRLAALEGIELGPEEPEAVAHVVRVLVAAAVRAESFPELEIPLHDAPRDPGRRPEPAQDPFNAAIRICRVEGAVSGPLLGKTVG